MNIMTTKDEQARKKIIFRSRIKLIGFALAIFAVAVFIHEETHVISYAEYGVKSSIVFDLGNEAEYMSLRTIPNTDDISQLCSVNVLACEDLRFLISEADVQAYQIQFPIFILIFMVYMLILAINSRGR